jgi:carbon-monoxide dehydrogenase small subunit
VELPEGKDMSEVLKKIKLNGKTVDILAACESRLLDVIREKLKLTGTKEGCGEGECGACSIILNGDAVYSCLMLFGQLADGDIITTIEGIGKEHLSRLQDAFVSEGGVQCGFCTPGMIIAAHALLLKNPAPTRSEIANALSGNLCRCTGYKKIITSVEKAADKPAK